MTCSPARAQTVDEGRFRVTLLGTGSPVPQPDRFGPATLVEAGGQALLFDAGRGATIRLFQLGVPLSQVSPLFLTHFHSDHTVGIPDVWLSGWLGGPWARRTTPFRVVGPTGAKELMLNLQRAYEADIKIRTADEKYPAEGIKVVIDEFTTGGRRIRQGRRTSNRIRSRSWRFDQAGLRLSNRLQRTLCRDLG